MNLVAGRRTALVAPRFERADRLDGLAAVCLALCLNAGLAGCGQKGALFIPDAGPVAEPAETGGEAEAGATDAGSEGAQSPPDAPDGPAPEVAPGRPGEESATGSDPSRDP